MTVKAGSLFTGYAGLDMAVESVLDAETIWHSEWEPPTKKNPRPSQAAARILEHRYPGRPNLGDVTNVDWSTVPGVDVLTGGFPCQDVSHAGKRAGMRAGTRSGMWAAMVDAIDALRPGLVFAENVRGLLSAEADSALEPCPGCLGNAAGGHALRAFGRVLGDLADLGYDARWYGLRAADIGACHGRYRIFITAVPVPDAGGETVGQRPGLRASGQGRVRWGRFDDDSVSPTLTNTDEQGSQGRESAARRHLPDRRATPDTQRSGRQRRRTDGVTGSPDATARSGASTSTDTDRAGGEALNGRQGTGDARRLQPVDGGRTDWGPYRPAIERWERVLGRVVPPPTELAPRGGQRLSPRFVEWMQGVPAGHVTDVPGISRNDMLKALGNGVVPQQGAAALRVLLAGESLDGAA